MTIQELYEKSLDHLEEANRIIENDLGNTISNSDAEKILEVMYHKALAAIMSRDNINEPGNYLVEIRHEEVEQAVKHVHDKMEEIYNLPMHPTFEDMKSMCNDDAEFNWFRHAEPCHMEEKSFWDIADVVGSMRGLAELIENGFHFPDNPSKNIDIVTDLGYLKMNRYPLLVEEVPERKKFRGGHFEAFPEE